MKPVLTEHLRELFLRPSYLPDGWPAAKYCHQVLREAGFTIREDEAGNTWAHRGRGPLLNAHLDTVQTPLDMRWLESSNELYTDGLSFQGINSMIGADDKCGLAIILALAETTDLKFQALLTAGEESGCLGSRNAEWSYLKGAPYALCLDRMNAGDCILSYNGKELAPKEFFLRLRGIAEEVGWPFSPLEGKGIADAYYLAEHLPCANLGVGYYNPHSTRDYCVIDETLATARFVAAVLGAKA